LIDHISYSGLSTYTECGEKFRLTRDVGIPEVPGWALVGGSAVHTATENVDREFMGQMVPHGQPMNFKDAFTAQIEKELKKSGVPEESWRVSGRATKEWPLKETKEWWLFHGQSFVDNYVNWRNRYPGDILLLADGTPAIEIPVDFQLGDSHITGYIDRIFLELDGSLRVVDLKAGRTTPTEALQLATYGLGVECSEGQTLGLRVTHGSYFMAREGMLIGDYDLTKIYPRLRYDYEGAWNAINSGYFPAKKSFMCKYCSARDWCYAESGEFSDLVRPF
jgi:hypothetical protein